MGHKKELWKSARIMPSRADRVMIDNFGTAVFNLFHHRSTSLRSPLPMIVRSCKAAILTSSTMVHAATSRYQAVHSSQPRFRVMHGSAYWRSFSPPQWTGKTNPCVFLMPCSYSVLQTGAHKTCMWTGNQSASHCYTTKHYCRTLVGYFDALHDSGVLKLYSQSSSLKVIRDLKGVT